MPRHSLEGAFTGANRHVRTIVTQMAIPFLLLLPLAVKAAAVEEPTRTRAVQGRTLSPINWCFKWAQQSALVNGTIYLYGGEQSHYSSQTTNIWNNFFITINVSESWPFSTPPFKGLPEPSGVPAVALGSLWASYDSLFLYGGEFSTYPTQLPVPFSTWEYNIKAAQWTSYANPTTSAGKGAPQGGVPVQRAAEGSGYSVAGLGRGWYFGGHEDWATTAGWSYTIPRIYLKSLLEYTFPGYSNSQVTALSGGQTAGSAGVYRNITSGGDQATAGFTKRADGVLLYIPGFGKQGILVQLAGGTSASFTELSVIDVFDIANSVWYRQATTGETPKIRANPCAVVAAAADGSSYNIYMFGGQNLTPYKNQTQYSDTWILTIPSFTWINANPGGGVPLPRAGHTCNIWDAQMVSVGGYMTNKLTCDYPGVYVLDLSLLQWVPQFTSTSNPKTNPFSQQLSQRKDPLALQGSYGYQVPEKVHKVIGGGPTGGATLTAPVVTATAGPLATGSAPTYTVIPGPSSFPYHGNGSSSSSSSSSGISSGAKSGIIAASVIAFVLLIVAIYLGFCAYLYRKQLQIYKQRYDTDGAANGGGAAGASGGKKRRGHKTGADAAAAGEKRGRGEKVDGPPDPDSGYVSAQVSGRPSARPSQKVVKRRDSSADLLDGKEPTFVGIMLHPRRSLRVVNPD